MKIEDQLQEIQQIGKVTLQKKLKSDHSGTETAAALKSSHETPTDHTFDSQPVEETKDKTDSDNTSELNLQKAELVDQDPSASASKLQTIEIKVVKKVHNR